MHAECTLNAPCTHGRSARFALALVLAFVLAPLLALALVLALALALALALVLALRGCVRCVGGAVAEEPPGTFRDFSTHGLGI